MPKPLRVSFELTRAEVDALLGDPYLTTLRWGYHGDERECVRRASEALVVALRDARTKMEE